MHRSHALTWLLLLALLAAALPLPAALASPHPQTGDDISNALAAFWHLDATSGTRADTWVNSVDLLDGNTVTNMLGKGGPAAYFTRANSEYLYQTVATALAPGDADYTFALWVRLTTKPADMGIVTKADNGTTREYALYYDSVADSFIFELYAAGGASIGTAEAGLFTPLVDEWYFVICSYDASEDAIQIEIDNTYVGLATASGTPAQTGANFELGRNEASEYLDGALDELWFWDRLLTSAEKDQLLNDNHGATLASAGGGMAYFYTETLDMTAGLPANSEYYWFDPCLTMGHNGYTYTGIQASLGNTLYYEASDVPSWGQVIDADIGTVCNNDYNEAETQIQWWWQESRQIRYVHMAYYNDGTSGKGRVYAKDDLSGLNWTQLVEGDTSNGVWKSLYWIGNQEAYGVQFYTWDNSNAAAPTEDTAVIDDILVNLMCYGAPCHSDPIPIVEAEYDDVICYAETADCSLYSWLRTTPDAFAYSTVNGTVVIRTQADDGSYMVIIEDESGVQWAYTNLATAFVGYGDTVDEGCLLGQVAPYPGTVPDYDPTTSYGALGWAEITAGVYSDPWPVVWHHALPGDFCGQGYNNENCNLNNPYFFDSATGWDYTPEGDPVQPAVIPFSGHPDFSGGVVLEEAESYLHYLYDEPAIWQQTILDPDSTYYVTVVAQQSQWLSQRVIHMGDVGHVRVTLGDATPELLTVDGVKVSILEFGPITPIPDGLGNLTTVLVENDGYNELSIYHVCVSNASQVVGPGNCFFDDWNFQSPYVNQEWTYTPGAGAEPNPPWFGIPSSTLDMPTWVELVASDNLLQNKTLYPEDGGGQMDYRLQVRATAQNATSAAGDWATLDVTFGAYSNTFTFDFDDWNTTAAQEDTFSVTTNPVTDDFEFEVAAVNGNVTAVDLEYVCLLADEPGGLPGYDDAIPNPGDTGQPATCVTCRPPGGLLNVAEWVKFLACVIKNLYYCHLVGMVERLITILRDAAKLVYKLGTWFGNMWKLVLGWIKGLVIGVLNRLLAALVAVLNALLQLDFIAALLESATITTEFVGRAVGLIARLVTLLGKGLGLAGSLAKAVDRMADTFIDALNSSSEASLTYPDCQDQDDALYGICQGLAVVDSRLPMAVINMLGMGGLGLALTLWTMGKFADILKD